MRLSNRNPQMAQMDTDDTLPIASGKIVSEIKPLNHLRNSAFICG